MKKLNLSDLDIDTFTISDKVTIEAVWPCTGCLSGCGINPPA